MTTAPTVLADLEELGVVEHLVHVGFNNVALDKEKRHQRGAQASESGGEEEDSDVADMMHDAIDRVVWCGVAYVGAR